MGITTSGIEPHWNYLLALDADLVQLSRYIDFQPDNFECFSIEMARIFLAAASEVDVVCKQVCRQINVRSKADNINQYRNEIVAAYPYIPEFAVLLPRFGLTLHPWDEWKKKGAVPIWWTSYNKVKHERAAHFNRANLKNTINSVAGLFVMVLHLYEKNAATGELAPPPQLLHVDEAHHGGVHVGGHEIGIAYNLDGSEDGPE